VTAIDVLRIVLRESGEQGLKLDDPADQRRVVDEFAYLMRSQDPHGRLEQYRGPSITLYRLD
jgi:hypothetical protein